jgi:hypothetical protein
MNADRLGRPGDAEEKGRDRRRFARHPVDAPVEIEWGSGILYARAADISLGGMFLKTADPLWVNAQFSARVLLDKPLVVDCVVRRVVPAMGMGVQFERLSPDTHSQLESFLESLPAE